MCQFLTMRDSLGMFAGGGGTAPEIVEKFAELFRLVRLVRNSPFSGIKRHTELDY